MGETSSGKTHTLIGNEENHGVLQEITKELLGKITNPIYVDSHLTLNLSILQVYNERITDLLVDFNNNPLKIKKGENNYINVEGITVKEIFSLEDLQSSIQFARLQQFIFTSVYNIRRSSMVTLLTLYLSKIETITGSLIQTSKINFIIFTGSERVSRTGQEEFELKEAQWRGKSINALLSIFQQNLKSEMKDLKCHIPYRDSKLTCITQDSFSNTFLLFHFFQSESHYYQSLNLFNIASKCHWKYYLSELEKNINEKIASHNLQINGSKLTLNSIQVKSLPDLVNNYNEIQFKPAKFELNVKVCDESSGKFWYWSRKKFNRAISAKVSEELTVQSEFKFPIKFLIGKGYYSLEKLPSFAENPQDVPVYLIFDEKPCYLSMNIVPFSNTCEAISDLDSRRVINLRLEIYKLWDLTHKIPHNLYCCLKFPGIGNRKTMIVERINDFYEFNYVENFFQIPLNLEMVMFMKTQLLVVNVYAAILNF